MPAPSKRLSKAARESRELRSAKPVQLDDSQRLKNAKANLRDARKMGYAEQSEYVQKLLALVSGLESA
jgi:hypothetical protein